MARSKDTSPLGAEPPDPPFMQARTAGFGRSTGVFVLRVVLGALLRGVLLVVAVIAGWYALVSLGDWIGGPVGRAVANVATLALLGLGGVGAALRIGSWGRILSTHDDPPRMWSPRAPDQDRSADGPLGRR